MRKTTIAFLTLAALAVTGPALASDDDDHRRCRLQAGQTMLSEADVKARLEAAGYVVRKIEADDGCYEVYLSKGDGGRREAQVHPATGQIVGWDD